VYLKHVVTLKQSRPLEGAVVESYEDEREVIAAWLRLLAREQPDVIYGYNTDQFDWRYLFKLAQRLGVPFAVGQLRGVLSEYQEKVMESSAFGFNQFFLVSTPGILNMDVMQAVKRAHKLESYSLKNVFAHFLGEHKDDMKYNRMFDLFEEGTPEGIREIAKYCVQDTMLPINLANKLNILIDHVEMARATYVPVDYLLKRGQQIKIFSCILRRIRGEYLIRTFDGDEAPPEETYQGATVLDARAGVYMDPVVVCDFASLYPSIMRAHNLCLTMWVADARFEDLPGYDYATHERIDDDGKVTKTRFVKNRKGVIPALLEELGNLRKLAKQKMKQATEPFQKRRWNSMQLAMKM
jgi:DNA polymerase delta subunit 1